jgi:hypothetical protein
VINWIKPGKKIMIDIVLSPEDTAFLDRLWVGRLVVSLKEKGLVKTIRGVTLPKDSSQKEISLAVTALAMRSHGILSRASDAPSGVELGWLAWEDDENITIETIGPIPEAFGKEPEPTPYPTGSVDKA